MLPEKVVDYNVYSDTQKLLGISGEVALPNLEAMSETVSGAGILGEFDSPNIGHFGAMTIELTFKTLFDTSFNLAKNDGKPIILRAAQMGRDLTGGKIQERGLKITIKGPSKGVNLGKLAKGAATETVNTIEVLYLKVEENGKVLLELDKLNYIYILNGVDMLANIKKYI